MQLFGLTITRKALAPVPARPHRSLFGTVLESASGMWQREMVLETKENILAFSAVYSCVSLISNDVSKLRIKLVKQAPSGIWSESTAPSPFLPLFRKPNRYQTYIQFLSFWMVCKLLYGNVYVLKERDQRGIVTELYILDPRTVVPHVSPDGSVMYQVQADWLAGVPNKKFMVPADRKLMIPDTEIIHDRMTCLWHPLVGVSPIAACGASATQGIKIQNNSSKFFENMSRPGGILSAPGVISGEQIDRLKRDFEANYSGINLGRLLVTGDGLKYEPMTIPPNDAQLLEQLRYTAEDVGRAFHVPLHKIGLGQNTFSNIAALNQDYYSQCLQAHIESIEVLLDEGCALPMDTSVELDLDGLLRMDPLSQAETNLKEIQAGYLKPNEARLRRNLEPVEGGDTPYLQQQNFSLGALSKRDARLDPFAMGAPKAPEPAAPAPPPEEKFLEDFRAGLKEFDHVD